MGFSEPWLTVVEFDAGLRDGSGGSDDAGAGGQQQGDAADFADHLRFLSGRLMRAFRDLLCFKSRTSSSPIASADLPKLIERGNGTEPDSVGGSALSVDAGSRQKWVAADAAQSQHFDWGNRLRVVGHSPPTPGAHAGPEEVAAGFGHAGYVRANRAPVAKQIVRQAPAAEPQVESDESAGCHERLADQPSAIRAPRRPFHHVQEHAGRVVGCGLAAGRRNRISETDPQRLGISDDSFVVSTAACEKRCDCMRRRRPAVHAELVEDRS